MIVGFGDDLPSKRPESRTGCTACLLRSIRRWSACWGAVAAPGRAGPAGAVRVPGPDPQGRPTSAGHPAAAEGAEDSRAPGPGHIRGSGRADRRRSGHRGGRARGRVSVLFAMRRDGPSTNRSRRPQLRDRWVCEKNDSISLDVEAEHRVAAVSLRFHQHLFAQPPPDLPKEAAEHIKPLLALQLP